MSNGVAGRPENASRANAALMGDKTYHGSPHSKCGTTERYTKGGACVHCARIVATEQREARTYLLSQSQIAVDTPQEMVVELTPEEQFARSIEDDLF